MANMSAVRSEAKSFLKYAKFRAANGEVFEEVVKDIFDSDLSGEGEFRGKVREEFGKLVDKETEERNK